MKKDISQTRWNTVLSTTLRLFLLFYIIAVWAGLNFPFLSGDKSEFIALIAIGAAVSLVGHVTSFSLHKITDPINIIGSLIGIVSVLIIIFALKDINMPFIKGFKAAFLVLAVLLVVKSGLKMLQDSKRNPKTSR